MSSPGTEPASALGRIGSALAGAIGLFALLGAINAIASPNLYVSMGGGVGVIDAASGTLRYTLPAGRFPDRATLNADHTRLYVLDPVDWTLTILDTKSRATLQTIALTGRPIALAIPPDDSRVYVGMEHLRAGQIGAVQAVDTQLGLAELAQTVDDGFSMAVSPDGSTLYFDSFDRCELYSLDTNDFSPRASHTLDCSIEASLISQDGATLYVNSLGGALYALDSATLETRVSIAMPWSGGDIGSPMAITRDGTEVVVGSAASGTIAFVDAVHGVLETTNGSCPGATGVAFSADERFVYVLCISSFEGAVLDARTHALLRTFPAGSYPSSYGAFVGDPAVPIYVVDGDQNGDVVALDSFSHALGTPARVGRLPEHALASRDGHRIYVSNGGDDTVSVVNADTHSEVATIAVGHHPTGLALSPDDSRLYVANTDDDSVAVIDTASRTVVATFSVDADSAPGSLATSADGAKLYVALSNWVYIAVYDTASGTLSDPIYCPSGISNLVMAPDGTKAYGAAGFTGEIYQIDVATDAVLATWDVGTDSSPFAHPLAISPDGGRLYIGYPNYAVLPESNAALRTVDTGSGTLLSWAPLDDTPASLAVEPEGRFVYAALKGLDSIEIVDTTTRDLPRVIGGFHAPSAIAPPVEPLMDGLFGSGFD